MVHDLRMLLRLAAGRNAQPTGAIFDSRTLQSSPESGERAGYDGAKRRKGSHVFYRHPDGRTTTAPDHGNQDLGHPLIRKILHDIGITPELYHEELENL